MKIIQFIPTIAYGDAVGNDTVALKQAMLNMGYDTEIYAESIVPPLGKETATKIEGELPNMGKEDVAILHLSTGAELNFSFGRLSCRKIVIYHNITPPEYFHESDTYIEGINKWAIEGAKYLADKVDYCIAVSEYNKKELVKMGYTCPIDVLPILIPFEDYKKTPSEKILKKYDDGEHKNIVFTGRVVPNKKQEDIIAAFYHYKKYYNPKSRLFLVGSYAEENIYYRRLRKYVEELKLNDVYFTGHIKFDEILAYYNLADVFLCMSEHEGFCVPLVEAMFFRKPIVAYNSSAIPYTLGGTGWLLDTKRPLEVAGAINYIIVHPEVRQKIIEGQVKRLQDFSYERIYEEFERLLTRFLEGNNHENSNS